MNAQNILATVLILITIYRQDVSSGECDSEMCHKLAEEIKASLDESVDPCQDFWSFACGKWQDTHTIPDDKKEVTIFDELQEELTMKVKTILETPVMSEIDPFYLKSAKKFYQKCTDEKSLEEDDGKSLKKSFDSIGGFAMVDKKKWTKMYENSDADDKDGTKKVEDIFAFIVELFKYGHEYKSIMVLESMPDMTNTSRTILGLSQGQLYDPDLNNGEYKELYKGLMKDLLVMLGAKDDSTLEEQMDEVVQFEKDFGELDLSIPEKKDPSALYKFIEISDLSTEYPGIPWVKFFKGIFEIDYSDMGNHAIVVNDKFFKGLPDLLKKTPIRVVINFMLWSITKGVPYALSKRFRDRLFEFNRKKTGQKKEEERWKKCSDYTNNYFPEAVSVGFINAFFGRKERQNAEELVTYVRKEFNNVLDHLEWIDEETKKVAVEKLSKMILAVGFPDEVLNKTVMDTYYMGCDVGGDKDTFFGSDRRVNKWRNKKELENVGQLAERDEFHNFGALAFITGHELTHGFDDVGKQFDPEGNDKKWWTKVTDKKFANKGQCLIDQHNKFSVMDSRGNKIQVNGSNTLDENIADVGGLKIAFRAYEQYVKDKKLDTSQTLPGLKYKFKELFYIKFATVWCNKERDEMLKDTVINEDHSIARMRVIGSIVNSEDFGESFNCPIDSPMNPGNKCLIW